jgi:hypothetical protein
LSPHRHNVNKKCSSDDARQAAIFFTGKSLSLFQQRRRSGLPLVLNALAKLLHGAARFQEARPCAVGLGLHCRLLPLSVADELQQPASLLFGLLLVACEISLRGIVRGQVPETATLFKRHGERLHDVRQFGRGDVSRHHLEVGERIGNEIPRRGPLFLRPLLPKPRLLPLQMCGSKSCRGEDGRLVQPVVFHVHLLLPASLCALPPQGASP